MSAARVNPPPYRWLRGYAFDPSLSTTLETVGLNEAMFEVPWEPLAAGPVGEYLEVIDYDPASERLYAPVDLEHSHILAQDGLAPSECSPQFHQQMVYAVAMVTIRNFEKALGRKALWAAGNDYQYVPRLRIYPHALRGANAFYSPDQKALLFGYFRADEEDRTHAPGSNVFTCLSHDIIAHETTHALLDGMHRRMIEPTHPDNLAFHEAFADLVAIFQHFTFPKSLKDQIARTRGDLRKKNLLAELAQEFGHAIGTRDSLRSALTVNPDPEALANTLEPHDRGAILVAAVFEAFSTIYHDRAARTIRLATAGSGELPAGRLPELLVETLAEEAAKTAQHFLGVCIRALDYCPPVGLTFGDYLRAMITADRALVPEDSMRYRLALIDAFRKRGIFAPGVPNLAEETLAWPNGREFPEEGVKWLVERLQGETEWLRYAGPRQEVFERAEKVGAYVHQLLRGKPEAGLLEFGKLCGLVLDPAQMPPGMETGAGGFPKFQISFRTALRARPDGAMLNHVILTLTQRRRIDFGDGTGYWFRGGATLILDLDSLELRHVIRRPITDEARRAACEAYMREGLAPSIRHRFFSRESGQLGFEPLAFLHGHDWKGEDHAD